MEYRNIFMYLILPIFLLITKLISGTEYESFSSDIKGSGIYVDSKLIFIEGENIQLNCFVLFKTQLKNVNISNVKLNFSVPHLNQMLNQVHTTDYTNVTKNSVIVGKKLKISNASVNIHSGTYFCNSEYNGEGQTTFINVQVWDKMEIHNIKITHTNGLLQAGENFTLTCEFYVICNIKRSIKVYWNRPGNQYYNNDNRTTFNRHSKCINNLQSYYNNINIIHADVGKDTGNYSCYVRYIDGEIIAQKILFVGITDQNNFYLFPDNLKLITNANLNLSIPVRYLQANKIFEVFMKLSRIQHQNQTFSRENKRITIHDKENLKEIHIENIQIDDTANYTFIFSNSKYKKTLIYEIYVQDKPYVNMKDVYTKQGSQVLLECIAKAFPKPKFIWNFIPDNENFDGSNFTYKLDDELMELRETNLTFKLNTLILTDIDFIGQLYFKPIQNGFMKCTTNNSIGFNEVMSKVTVGDIVQPFDILLLNESIKNDEKIAVLGEQFSLECAALIVRYHNNISWLKGEQIISNSSELIVLNDQTQFSYRKTLKFYNLRSENLGNYECEVYPLDNIFPERRIITIKIIAVYWWYYMFATVGVLLILLILGVSMRLYHEKKKWNKMKSLGFENFEKGATECINPHLTVAEQADLLPYNKKIEIPKKNIKLGKVLGSGTFGVVYEGYVKNLIAGASKTTVAVKMINTDNNVALKSLLTELKIMIHLGRHINIVNLMGAVTKNITRNELMVLVEYCKFGNIKTFLMQNSKNFINQIDTETDTINLSLDISYLRKKKTAENEAINLPIFRKRQLNEYSPDHGNSSSNFVYTKHYSKADQFNSSCFFEHNQKNDPKENCYAITTTNLLSWAFQIACGMKYLTSRKVLHGDLAARNILLCENNIVKISDFGLSKSMTYRDTYKKYGQTPLPIKWLAIESLRDSTFGTYSDVWAFGITMWEIFSLGKVPYPGVTVDNFFLHKLLQGYRMSKPQYATHSLYKIMQKCWDSEPLNRPKFQQLENELCTLLDPEVTTKLADFSLESCNSLKYQIQNDKDYLNLMCSPDEKSSKLSNATNHNGANIDNNTDDYVPMLPIKREDTIENVTAVSVYANDLKSLRIKHSHKLLLAQEILLNKSQKVK